MKEEELKRLREEAFEQMKKDEGPAMRSCWNCNSGHEHLKGAKCVIVCFECGHYYFKGEDITEPEPLLNSPKEE